MMQKKVRQDVVDRKAIRLAAVKDTCLYSIIAVPVIIVFELVLIAMWIAKAKDGNISFTYWGYLGCYIFLSAVSAITLALLLIWRKDTVKHAAKIIVLQTIYAFSMVAWAVALTHFEALDHGNFSIAVFATIVTIIPVFTFIHPAIWMPTLLAGDVYIVVIGYLYQSVGRRGFIINFVVFAVMSALSSLVFHKIRYMGYVKQQQYASLSNLSLKFAYLDDLSGLGNRRAYNEKFDKFSQDGVPENFCFIMMDLNRLKAANDEFGHEAGDELIQASAAILIEAFGLDACYRIGGDEFVILASLSQEEAEAKLQGIEEKCKAWKGSFPTTLALSTGAVFPEDTGKLPMHDITLLADKRMYEAKKRYYEEAGFDRRIN